MIAVQVIVKRDSGSLRKRRRTVMAKVSDNPIINNDKAALCEYGFMKKYPLINVVAATVSNKAKIRTFFPNFCNMRRINKKKRSNSNMCNEILNP